MHDRRPTSPRLVFVCDEHPFEIYWFGKPPLAAFDAPGRPVKVSNGAGGVGHVGTNQPARQDARQQINRKEPHASQPPKFP